MTKPPDQSPDAWSDTSESYDANVVPLLGPFARQLVDVASFGSSDEVVEVAAGSGLVTEMLAEVVGQVVATDFASGMVDILRTRCAASSNVEALVMDGQDLKLDDGRFDAAVSNFGFMFFPDRVRGFAELHRVLKPGGRALVSTWKGPEHFPAFSVFASSVAETLPDLPRPPGPPALFTLADPSILTAEMQQGGFDRVEIVDMEHTFEAESAAAYWDMMKEAAPPTKALLDRVGSKNTEKIRDCIIGKLTAQFGSGPVRFVNGANLAIGTKA
jgi:SAM-dependent methyltransferase